jgi:hypothetical protein
VEAAVSLARTDLTHFRGRFLERSEEFDAMLQDVVALLAYTEPEVCLLAILPALPVKVYPFVTIDSVLSIGTP